MTRNDWLLGAMMVFFAGCNCGARRVGADCSMAYTTGIRQRCDEGLVCVKRTGRPCPDGEFDACFGVCVVPCSPDGRCNDPCRCQEGVYCAPEPGSGLGIDSCA